MLDINWEVSARHIHLCQAHVDWLFGKDCELSFYKELSQPGQFACKEQVTVSSVGGLIENVRILGPCRTQSVVELSLSDARQIKLPNLPIKLSGDDILNVPVVTLSHKERSIIVPAIVAMRHIHLSPIDSQTLALTDGDQVGVEFDGLRGKSILGGFVVRVSPMFKKMIHIDTDEYNAILPKPNKLARLVYSNNFLIMNNGKKGG